jgi:hypothetical protein
LQPVAALQRHDAPVEMAHAVGQLGRHRVDDGDLAGEGLQFPGFVGRPAADPATMTGSPA